MGTFTQKANCQECGKEFLVLVNLPMPSDICAECYGKHMLSDREATEQKYGYNIHYHMGG